jgi:RecB family endonuclease NucS
MLKRDGSVSVHSDDRAYKPLNWMLTPCEFVESVDQAGRMIWTFESKKDTLRIVFHDVSLDLTHEWEAPEPGLARQWTEADLQAWIAENSSAVFGKGWRLVAREYQTGAGPVDLLIADPNGRHVAVEVKRMAHMPAVDQIQRYVSAIQDDPDDFIRGPVRGIVAALEFKGAAIRQAEKHNVQCIVVHPY